MASSSSGADQTIERSRVLEMAVRAGMSRSQRRVSPTVNLMRTVTEAVTPVELVGNSDGIMSIASLNPDLNGDGQVEPWEKEVYQKLLESDWENGWEVIWKIAS